VRSGLEDEGLSLRCQFRGTSAKRLRDEFLANESLSLFALRSFWEGFDAPGRTLRCVVIPRLPFGRPNDPLQLQRAQNERNAWKRYVLPEAVIDLKQAAGRLIRSATDSGYLVLADSRLTTKSYGAEFLRALPSQTIYRLNTAELLAHVQGGQ
jgi:ATP-dependent DNA helicase DinG